MAMNREDTQWALDKAIRDLDDIIKAINDINDILSLCRYFTQYITDYCRC